MINVRSTLLPTRDILVLAVCVPLLVWMKVDWQGYSDAVDATLGAALRWVLDVGPPLILDLVGFGQQ